MAPWYKLGNAWYNGEGGYSETDPNAPAVDNSSYEGWVYGADFSQGMNEYRAPDGGRYIYNNSQHMGGPKLFSYDGRPVPPEVLAMVQAKVPDVQIGSDALMRQSLLDPDAPGNREGGSDLANIMGVLGFVGGGAALTGGSSLWSSLGDQLGISNPFAGATPDASWGANPQSFIGDELMPPTNMSYQPSFIGDELIPPTGSQLSNYYSSPGYLDMIKAGGALGGATQAPAPVQDFSKPYVGPGAGTAATGLAGAASRLANGTATAADYMSLLGTAGGALAGSMNGSQQAGTTTSVTDIPDWLKPAAMKLIGQGDTMVGQNMVSPGTFNQSDSIMNGIMGGSISNPHLGDENPYFEQMLTKSLNDTQGRVNAQFGNRSAFGGSANQELLQRGLGDQSNAMRFGQFDKQTALYENDINRRLATATSQPAYSAAKTSASFAPLTAQKGLLNFGGSQTSQPYFNNPTGGALYGGLLGSQLFGGK
jgi:hypothetical protein